MLLAWKKRVDLFEGIPRIGIRTQMGWNYRAGVKKAERIVETRKTALQGEARRRMIHCLTTQRWVMASASTRSELAFCFEGHH
jgi:hypothetical protein